MNIAIKKTNSVQIVTDTETGDWNKGRHDR